MTVEFHPDAFREAVEAQAWYEERSLLAASGFIQELSRAIQRIRHAPNRYAVAEAGTRKILLDRFPFTIYYPPCPMCLRSWQSHIRNGVRATGSIGDAAEHLNGADGAPVMPTVDPTEIPGRYHRTVIRRAPASLEFDR